MIQYFNNIIYNNISYSVDMIRLRLDFGLEQRIVEFGEWCNRFDNIHIECFPLSTKAYAYRYLFKVTCNNASSFVCGLGFNGDDRDCTVLGFLEFNPNKVASDRKFIEFFEVLKNFCPRTDIVRWDLAVDVPLEREYCSLVKDKRKYSMVRNSVRDCTEYLGRRSSSGFVKLYNKSVEDGLEEDVTRLEITVDGKMNYSEFCTLLPQIDVSDYQLSLFQNDQSLSSTDALIVDLIRKLPLSERQFYFKRLHSQKRVKLRPFIYPATAEKELFVVPKEVYGQLKRQLRDFDFGTCYDILDNLKDIQ